MTGIPTKVLLTGAAGVVGAHALRALLAEGRDVAIVLRPTTNPRRILDVLDRVRVVFADLCNQEELRRSFRYFKPDAVLHLAWGGVKGSMRNDLAQLDNVGQALMLYQIAMATGCARFVGLGSQAEYGPQFGVINEAATPHPTNLYGVSKLATASLLRDTAKLAGTPFAWLRLFSSYGPDDEPSYMIPYLIGELLAGRKPCLTRGEQIWDYIHLGDVASALIAAMDQDARGIFNLGTGKAYPLRQIIETIRNAIDPSLPLGFGEVEYRPDQVMHLEADISALRAATGWSPRYALHDGLAETVAWYRDRHV